MSEKPISPLRQRMIEDMAIRPPSVRRLTNTQARIRPAKTGSLSVCFRAEPAIWRLCALIAAAAFHVVNSSVAGDLGSECEFALDGATRRHCEAIGK